MYIVYIIARDATDPYPFIAFQAITNAMVVPKKEKCNTTKFVNKIFDIKYFLVDSKDTWKLIFNNYKNRIKEFLSNTKLTHEAIKPIFIKATTCV